MREASTKVKRVKPGTGLSYFVCPRCQRAVPAEAGELYCANDGAPLLQACTHCGAAITSPYNHFCTACGKKLLFIEESE